MKHKLKHLAKFCCMPANELEFEFIKREAELADVWFDRRYEEGIYYFYNLNFGKFDCGHSEVYALDGVEKLSVLDFIAKLRMSEEEAEKLWDDRVNVGSSFTIEWNWSDDEYSMIALNDHYFKTNEDGTEVTLHKRESC